VSNVTWSQFTRALRLIDRRVGGPTNFFISEPLGRLTHFGHLFTLDPIEGVWIRLVYVQWRGEVIVVYALVKISNIKA